MCRSKQRVHQIKQSKRSAESGTTARAAVNDKAAAAQIRIIKGVEIMRQSTMRLTPATHKFTVGAPRGMYPRMIRAFLNSGESEMNVEAESKDLAYLGLRGAVSNMGLKGRVYVKRQDGEVHLIRQE